MNIGGVFIFIATLTVIYVLIIVLLKNEGQSKKETLDYNGTEKIFFENINNGKVKYELLKIYTPFDLMMIKSLFISENIPYYVEFEHLMKVYPFVYIENYNNSRMYILEEDYDDAITVVKYYIGNKALEEYKIKYALRGIIEYFLMGWVVTSPQNHLGLDINYKVSALIKAEDSNDKKIDDTIPVLEYQENYDIEQKEGNDFKNNEIWICSRCKTLNEIYLIKCKECRKIID